jgi:hypothetical protein
VGERSGGRECPPYGKVRVNLNRMREMIVYVLWCSMGLCGSSPYGKMRISRLKSRGKFGSRGVDAVPYGDAHEKEGKINF